MGFWRGLFLTIWCVILALLAIAIIGDMFRLQFLLDITGGAFSFLGMVFSMIELPFDGINWIASQFGGSAVTAGITTFFHAPVDALNWIANMYYNGGLVTTIFG